MTETRAEVGTLFCLLLLAMGALGALFAFCWRKRGQRTQSFELEPTEDSTSARLRELKDAVKAHQDESAEDFRSFKQSVDTLMSSLENSQKRGERERDAGPEQRDLQAETGRGCRDEPDASDTSHRFGRS